MKQQNPFHTISTERGTFYVQVQDGAFFATTNAPGTLNADYTLHRVAYTFHVHLALADDWTLKEADSGHFGHFGRVDGFPNGRFTDVTYEQKRRLWTAIRDDVVAWIGTHKDMVRVELTRAALSTIRGQISTTESDIKTKVCKLAELRKQLTDLRIREQAMVVALATNIQRMS